MAAGRGERMGAARPKAFLSLGGEPLLLKSARPFDAVSSVGSIVAVVPAADVETARSLLAPIQKLVAVVAGGERRQDSVLAGLKQAPDGFDGIVLVHDAARPFVDEALIEAVIGATARAGAALPLLPLVDTIKRFRDDQVVETVDRAELGAAQTPQGFRMDLLVRAYELAFRDQVTLTDEAVALERMGATVAVVPGSPRNRKITTPDDLAWAEQLLAGPGVGAGA